MTKGLAPIFFTTCGVVVAGVVGYAMFDQGSEPAHAPIANVETAPIVSNNKTVKPDEEKKLEAKLEQPEDDKPTESKTIKVKLTTPKFDVVRVEKDGSTVVAGQGPSGETIELMDGDNKLAETVVNSTGEFVFVLDNPLEPGSHELFLRVPPKNGDAVLSSSFAFVDVPKPNTIDTVTVLLAETGKPSQVLQKSEIIPSIVDVAKDDEIKIDSSSQIVSASAKESVSIAKPEDSVVVENTDSQVASTAESKLAPVLIDASDVEAGKIFIAGTGEPRTSINIYLENELLGTVKVADNGSFLFEADKDLKAGRHNIRADMTKGNGVEVLARAEVVLIHEPKTAKINKVKETEPKQALENTGAIEVDKSDTVSLETKTELTQDETPELLEAEKKEIITGSSVIIRSGDSLWTVARRNYGAGIRYTTIFNANRDQVRNPHKIYPGQVLKMPETKQTVE